MDQIEQAKSTLLVQAYGFTSPSIIQALARAKDRGVNVWVILDKSNEQPRYTGATYLTNHGIPVLIDDRVAIAHNKVLAIDGKHVITGSFNFTRAAQSRNAENVLVVTDAAELASSYTGTSTDGQRHHAHCARQGMTPAQLAEAQRLSREWRPTGGR